MALSIKEFQKLLKQQGLTSIQKENYNVCMTILSKIIQGNHIIVSERETIKLVSLEHDEFVKNAEETMKMTPCMARRLGITYDIPWYLNVEILTNTDDDTVIEPDKKKIFIGRIPVMVRSKLCSTHGMNRQELYEHGEDPNDLGGYFIIDGIHEKHTILQDQLCLDWLYVLVLAKNKKLKAGYSGYQTKSTITTARLSTHIITIDTVDSIQKFTFQSLPKKDDTKESVNILRIYRLMGIEDIEEIKKRICNFIPPEERDKCMNKLSASIYDFLSNVDDIEVMTSKLLTDDLKNKAKNHMSSDKSFKFRNKITNFNEFTKVNSFLEKMGDIIESNKLNTEKILLYIKEINLTNDDISKIKHILSTTDLTNEKKEKQLENYKSIVNKIEILNIIDNILYKDLFPQFNYVNQHISKNWNESQQIKRDNYYKDKRLNMLSYFLAEHLRHEAGYREIDDLDSWSNKRATSCGFHFMQVIRQTINNKLYNVRESLNKENTTGSIIDNLGSLKTEMANVFNKSFLTQTWLKKRNKKTESSTISYTVKNTNYSSYIESMFLMIAPVSSKSSLTEPREVKSTSWGFIGPERTPDSTMTGLTKYHACSTLLTTYIDMQSFINEIRTKCEDKGDFSPNSGYVIINGVIEGWNSNIKELRKYVINYRRITNSRNISVVIESYYLKIETGHSRLIRPLAIIDLETQTLKAVKDNNGVMPEFDLSTWLNKGWLEYISPREQEHIVICLDKESLNKHRKTIIDLPRLDEINYDQNTEYVLFTDDYLNEPFYLQEAKKRLIPVDGKKLPPIHIPYTHMELHSTALITFTGNLTIWPNHNQAPRNTYNAGMSSQALSRYNLHFREFMKDGMKTCITATYPLVRSPIFDTMGLKDCGFGCTARVAIMIHGSNQEDGTVISRSFLERGGFRKLIEYVKKISTSENGVSIGMPDEKYRHKSKVYHAIYQGQDKKSEGLPIIGSYIKKGDCILARRREDGTDASEYLGFGEEGVITNVHVLGGDTVKTEVVKIKFCKEYIPVQGDKYSPRNAQKGVCCLVLPEYEMPFTESGPIDILFTPFALPTRMTISMLVEMIAYKFAAVSCSVVDCSAHSDLDIQKRVKYLDVQGYNGNGYEKMFSARSGLQMANEVYVGEVFYQALHHLAISKIQGRSIGPISASTRQPIQGGRKGGGPKLGDMSMKALLANGLPFIVQERTMYESDVCTAIFCGNCGIFAERRYSNEGVFKIVEGKKVILDNPDYEKAYVCKLCKQTNFYSITIPHGLRLIIHYLMGMGIKAKMNIKPFSEASRMNTTIDQFEQDGIESEEEDDENANEDDSEEDSMNDFHLSSEDGFTSQSEMSSYDDSDIDFDDFSD